jgi:hypothetical protein
MDFEMNQMTTPFRDISSIVASPNTALKKSQDNRRFLSRASSPRQFQEQPRWLLDPSSRKHDPEIVNVFLKHLVPGCTFVKFMAIYIKRSSGPRS